MKSEFLLPALAGLLLLAGCGSAPQPAGNRAVSSTGPAVGKPAPASVGVLLGSLLGSDLGKSLSRADQAFMNQQTNKALETAPTRQTFNWKNPDNGAEASVTPTRTYQDPNGTYCRDYIQTVAAAGKQETARGTACRRSDGSWEAAG